MNTLQRCARFFQKPFFSNPRTLLALWLLLPLISSLMKLHKHNNFLVFRGVFWHLWQQKPLYADYPAEYLDKAHYGPFFGMVVAPFALLPEWVGLLCWETALSLSLFWTIRRLPIPHGRQVFVYWFCAHELLTALFLSQFNIATAALIIATFACLEKGRTAGAAWATITGTFVKLYGVVGLAFFPLYSRRWRFALWLLLTGALAFVLPMLLSSPHYVCEQYSAWLTDLASKNGDNMFSRFQNISFLGMVRKISGCAAYSDLWLIVPGMLLFALPYLRRSQYRHVAFRLAALSSVLLFVVLFSTGSESSSYIIAVTGVALWYVSAPWHRRMPDKALLIFVFVLTSMSPSDLFPAFLKKTLVQPYALKALPCMLVWLRLVWEMLTCDYSARLLTPLETRKMEEIRK